MTISKMYTQVVSAVALAGVLSFSPVVQASSRCVQPHEPIVIRQTIPDPLVVSRAPLTSDQLSTTSTRLIDARRGLRPYSSVVGEVAYSHRFVGYDDHFGMSRPENRPYSYSQRTPRSYVSQFRNDDRVVHEWRSQDRHVPPAYTLMLREQPSETAPQPDMNVRIHHDRSAIPTTSGAVLITSDGTVIQIGD